MVSTPVPALCQGWGGAGEDGDVMLLPDLPDLQDLRGRVWPHQHTHLLLGETRPDSDPVYLGPVLAERPEPAGSSLRSTPSLNSDIGPAALSGVRGFISLGEGVESFPLQAVV